MLIFKSNPCQGEGSVDTRTGVLTKADKRDTMTLVEFVIKSKEYEKVFPMGNFESEPEFNLKHSTKKCTSPNGPFRAYPP